MPSKAVQQGIPGGNSIMTVIRRSIPVVTAMVLYTVTTVASAAGLGDSAIASHGGRGGFAVYIGKLGDMVTAFITRSDYSLHALSPETGFVTAVRKRLNDAGVYGRCSAEHWDGGELPYVENLVSLLICDDAAAVKRDEALRVLSPGGLALFRRGEAWESLRKPLAADTDDWPQHFYAPGNNPVSRDALVGPPRHLQWRGSPRWGRFHEKMSSFAAMVSAGGRIFYIMDHGSPASLFFPAKWRLVARDAYNGVVLWSQPIDEWVSRFFSYKAGPATVPRRLVATDDVVYVTLGIKAPLSKLSARTGRVLATYPGTECTDEIVLVSDMLLVVRRPGLTVPTNKDNLDLKTRRRFGWQASQPATLLALDPATGQRLWEHETPVAPLCLAADQGRVYICDWKKLRCLDRSTGEEKWASSDLDIPASYPSGNAPRLAVKDGVVLFANSKNVNKRKKWSAPPDPLSAFSAATGKRLWTADHPASGFHSPEDLFIIGDTVWLGATMDGNGTGEFTGLALKTGTVRTTFKPDSNSYWFHQRCYPQKATQKYILTSRTGIEYVDPVTKHWELNHWVRGACTFGVMPANGYTYAPQHPCACYPESKLSGMNALAAKQQYSLAPNQSVVRLVKGSAYQVPLDDTSAATEEDWPCLRGNMARTSYAHTTLPGRLAPAWSTRLASGLTSPTVGGGRLFVATPQTHQVHALDIGDGKHAWSFTAGGRVDSPPTYAFGHVVFGSRDGTVYCLRAADGALRWRFLAARYDKRLFNFEQLESAWPVFGSVLVIGKEAFVTAGRSIFLDGGITFYRLDLATGRVVTRRQLTGNDPSGKDYHKWVSGLSMPPANNDVLSSNGRSIYMLSQVLRLNGSRVMRRPGAVNNADDDSHIFSPTGYLDGSWWHRGYYAYGNGVSGGAGWYGSLRRIISGKLICADRENVYSFGREPKYRKWTLPLEFLLTSTSKTKRTGQAQKRRSMAHPFQVHWSSRIPMLVKGMFVTDNTLVIAGPRDLYNEEEAISKGRAENDSVFALQQEHMEGKHGSLLKVIDKSGAGELSSMELDQTPTWNGLIAARGRVFMTTTEGSVVCFGEQ